MTNAKLWLYDRQSISVKCCNQIKEGNLWFYTLLFVKINPCHKQRGKTKVSVYKWTSTHLIQSKGILRQAGAEVVHTIYKQF